MSILSSQVVVGTTPLALVTPAYGGANDPYNAIVVNSGPSIVYVGGPTVSVAQGFPLPVGAVFGVDLQVGDNLYGIVATGSQTVSLMTITHLL